MHAPPALHDVFGESPSVREMVAVLAFGIVAAVWLTLGLRAEFPGLPWWRLTIAALVIADIASGCVANFTRSTNDFYAARPRHRWVFIAVHGHVLVLAAALGADLEAALVVWAYTVVAASVVNLLAGAPAQRFAAGLLLAVALVWIPQMKGLPAPLVVVDCLFVLKVVFAFAVDHRDGARVAAVHDAAVHDAAVHDAAVHDAAVHDAAVHDAAVHDAAVHDAAVHGEAVHGEAERAPIRELAAGDRSAFVAVMSAAFAHDPWIETALGPAGAPSSAGRRSAFLSFMFDHTRLLGGSPLGLFDGDRLVACALLESPTPRWRTVLGMVASAVRFAPVAMRLGARRTARLNAYVQRTRQIAPSAPHHYLTMIGVTPSEHRRGWGKQLMQALIARAEGVPTSCGLALDTENPDNVPIYQRWGFVITGSVELDVVCATAMFRTHADEPPPRASPSLAPSRP